MFCQNVSVSQQNIHTTTTFYAHLLGIHAVCYLLPKSCRRGRGRQGKSFPVTVSYPRGVEDQPAMLARLGEVLLKEHGFVLADYAFSCSNDQSMKMTATDWEAELRAMAERGSVKVKVSPSHSQISRSCLP